MHHFIIHHFSTHIMHRVIPCFVLLFATTITAAADPVTFPNGDKLLKSTEVYKKIGDVELKIEIVAPQGHTEKDKRPAIVFFFGGGWQSGSVTQFQKQSEYFASRGMVALAADYRVGSRHKVTPDKCVNDAKSAVRWVRANARRLGIDPDRIVAAGGSAGGHIAACTGIVTGYDEENEDHRISSVPSALVLFNPVLNTTPDGWPAKRGAPLVARFGEHGKALSPQHHVKKGNPPTLVIHGKADTTVPFAQAQAFAKAMVAAGNRCEVAAYDDQAHGFFNFGRGDNAMFIATTIAADKFLSSLEYLKGEPTLAKQSPPKK